MIKQNLRKIFNRYDNYGILGLTIWLSRVVRYLFLKYILRKSYHIREIHDYEMRLNLCDPGISRELMINGTREDQLRLVLQQEVESGMTILDIGANIGYYAIMLSRMTGDSGFVYAVEPAPLNYMNLIENIKHNDRLKNFETFNLGISNRTGKEHFYISTHSNLNTFIKNGFRDNYVTQGLSDNVVEVDVTDLTSFLKDKRNVDLIRMDVEGYEVEILEGLAEAIATGLFQGKIVFECHFPKYDEEKHSISKQLRMLFDNDYHVKALTSNDERRGTIRDLGYVASTVVLTGGVKQGIYYDISNEDAIELISRRGGIRDALFVKNGRKSK